MPANKLYGPFKCRTEVENWLAKQNRIDLILKPIKNSIITCILIKRDGEAACFEPFKDIRYSCYMNGYIDNDRRKNVK